MVGCCLLGWLGFVWLSGCVAVRFWLVGFVGFDCLWVYGSVALLVGVLIRHRLWLWFCCVAGWCWLRAFVWCLV